MITGHGARETQTPQAECVTSRRTQLPWHHRSRTVQNRHHAWTYSQEGMCRRSLPLGNPYLRGCTTDH